MKLNGNLLASLYNAHVERDEDGFRVFAPSVQTEEALVNLVLGIIRTYDANVSRRYDQFSADDEEALDELKRIVASSRQRQRRKKAKSKFAALDEDARNARIREIMATVEFQTALDERREKIRTAKTRRGRAKKVKPLKVAKTVLTPVLVAEAVLDDEIERDLIPTFYIERTPRAELDAFDKIFGACWADETAEEVDETPEGDELADADDAAAGAETADDDDDADDAE